VAASLTRRIGGAASWRDVRDLVASQDEDVNAVHVVAALQRLAQLLAPSGPQQQQQQQQQQQRQQQQPPSRRRQRAPQNPNARSSSNSRLDPSSEAQQIEALVRELLRRALARLPALGPRSVPPLLQAAARLAPAVAHPGKAWVVRVMTHTYHLLGRGLEAGGVGVAEAEAAGEGSLPSPSSSASAARWREQQDQQQQRQQTPGTLTPQGLANVVWALGKLGVRLRADWRARYFAAWLQPLPAPPPPSGPSPATSGVGNRRTLLDAAPPVALSLTLYGLAQCRWRPSATPRLELEAAASAADGNGSNGNPHPNHAPPAPGTSVWAAAAGDAERAWLPAMWRATRAAIPRMGARDLACALWALATLGLAPPPGWAPAAALRLAKLLSSAAGEGREGVCTDEELATCMWALARLAPGGGDAAAAQGGLRRDKRREDEEEGDDDEDANAAAAEQQQQQQQGEASPLLAVPPQTLALLYSASMPRLPRLGAHTLSSVAYGFAVVAGGDGGATTTAPPDPWLRALVARSRALLPRLGPRGLPPLADALARLPGAREVAGGDPQWRAALARGLAAAAPELGPRSWRTVEGALRRLGCWEDVGAPYFSGLSSSPSSSLDEADRRAAWVSVEEEEEQEDREEELEEEARGGRRGGAGRRARGSANGDGSGSSSPPAPALALKPIRTGRAN
jgi:hypothetical protein